MRLIYITPNDKRWYSLEDLPNEEWKDIKEFEGLYRVSNYGRIKSLKRNTARERIMKPRIGHDGYYYIGMTKNGITTTKKVHRIVATSFIKNYNYYPQVNHMDGDKLNNNTNNLEWCTASYNQKHAYENGLSKSWLKGCTGKNCPFSIMVDQFDKNGNFIKTWYAMSDVQRELNIPTSAISLCCKGKKKSYKGYVWKYHEEVV